jgi:hypothetical protein
MRKTILFSIWILLSLSAYGQGFKNSYIMGGVTNDSGNVGLLFSLRDSDFGLGESFELGFSLSSKNLLVANLSYLGYVSSDGTSIFTFSVEYNRLLKLPVKNLSLVYGGGIGVSLSFPAGPTIPLRGGFYYEATLSKRLALQFAILDRPQYFILRGGQFNNEISFMVGFKLR